MAVIMRSIFSTILKKEPRGRHGVTFVHLNSDYIRPSSLQQYMQHNVILYLVMTTLYIYIYIYLYIHIMHQSSITVTYISFQGIEGILIMISMIIVIEQRTHCYTYPAYRDSKVHEANMGPTWVLSSPGGPHVGPISFVIRVMFQ